MIRKAALFLASTAIALAAPSKLDFTRDIRPILSDKCFSCHGPDEQKRMAGLRLDNKDGAFSVRPNGAAIIAGDSAKSKLFERISHDKKALRMPPPAAGDPLTEKQVGLIKQWIDSGAPWATHWAYDPPKSPATPEVKIKGWVKNPIDNFVLARLESEGLKPSPEADRITLLRRLSFDIIGLPPTPGELSAFIADKSPNAYEKQVDRLLQSKHYGEKMAMGWLDLARYADTHGYHIDSHRDMWPWRDWVIQAFNNNKPFDKFTIEQLAGDLMPGANVASKIATGFNRNHMINFEGGAIPEEYQAEYVADRVETTSVVWMGMTIGCAKCHDHKYDPIRQKDFYQTAAFFNTIPEKGLDGRKGNAEPLMLLPSPEKQLLDELGKVIPEKEKKLPEKEVAKLQLAWEKTRLSSMMPASREGLLAHYEFEDSVIDTAGRYLHGHSTQGEMSYADGMVGRSGSFGGQQVTVEFPASEQIDPAKKFTLSFWFRPTGDKEVTIISAQDASGRGWQFNWEDSEAIPGLKRVGNSRIIFTESPTKSLDLRTRTRMAQNDWYLITIASEGAGGAQGMKLFVNGKPEAFEVVANTLSGSTATRAPIKINGGAGAYQGQFDDLRISNTVAGTDLASALFLTEPVRWLLFNPTAKRAKDQRDTIRNYFLSNDAPEAERKLWLDLKELKAQRDRLEIEAPSVMVMDEMEKPRETFMLGRGDYRNKGEKVSPNTPMLLPPIDSGLPRNRYGLAQWLVNPNHPLTARVAVNRYWQSYFGTGIVKTAEDFGSQGDAPSHPELLDYLATGFVNGGWDIRAMQRLIVTSATYRQSSKIREGMHERDPENRLLSRGPRMRLAAELVRDNVLFVSGLLNNEIGGRSVYPYQPAGIWEELAFGGIYSAQTYKQSHGADLWRRSMYTFWKRTAPPASMSTFDAPDREKCTTRRAVTNTPLQALVLWNDPTYVEAARMLAQRMLTEGGQDTTSRIRHGFELATGRKPLAKELAVLTSLAAQQLAIYAADKQAAIALLGVGEAPVNPSLNKSELAGFTTLASTILNLDEVITKE